MLPFVLNNYAIASIAWTVTHEEVVRAFRDYCMREKQDMQAHLWAEILLSLYLRILLQPKPLEFAVFQAHEASLDAVTRVDIPRSCQSLCAIAAILACPKPIDCVCDALAGNVPGPAVTFHVRISVHPAPVALRHGGHVPRRRATRPPFGGSRNGSRCCIESTELNRHHLPGFTLGFLGQLISLV
jgi:hypothetical protein